MDGLIILRAGVFALMGFFLGFLSSKYADRAAKEEGHRKAGIGGSAQMAYIVVNGLVSFLTALAASPATYFLIFVILAVFLIVNKEGRIRAASWNVLILLYAIEMIFSIAAAWDKGSAKFSQLGWLIVPLVVFILGQIKLKLSDRIDEEDEDDKGDKSKSDSDKDDESDEDEDDDDDVNSKRIIAWVLIALFAIIVIAAGIAVIKY